MTAAARGAQALVVGLLAVAPADARHPFPFRTAVVVVWGDDGGSDAFRHDVGRALTQSLSEGCFAAVEFVQGDPAAVSADLLLSVELSNVSEELRFEDSISGSLQPGAPDKEFRRVAYFEVSVQSSLATFAGHVPIARKQLFANASRRPVMVGEDPQVTARAEAIEQIVTALTKACCRGGAKQEAKIRDALAKDVTAPR